MLVDQNQSSVIHARRTRALRELLNHLDTRVTDQYPDIAKFEAMDYQDPVRAELERDRIFGEVPFIVAHSSEVARTGDFISLDLPRNKVVVVRQRDGSVRDVHIGQSSGIGALDYSCQRAILESAPFEPLPSGFERTSAHIEFWFQLKR